MQVPDRLVVIAQALHDAHLDLATGTDDQRRALTKLIAEQAAHDLGMQWGTKTAGAGRPPSKDAIAQMLSDGRLLSWDWQNGETRNVSASRDLEDITGQQFIPVVPSNHLGEFGTPVVVPPPVPASSQVLGELRELREELRRLTAMTQAVAEDRGAIAAIQMAQRELTAAIDAVRLSEPVPVVWPVYRGTAALPAFLGGTRTVTLVPSEK